MRERKDFKTGRRRKSVAGGLIAFLRANRFFLLACAGAIVIVAVSLTLVLSHRPAETEPPSAEPTVTASPRPTTEPTELFPYPVRELGVTAPPWYAADQTELIRITREQKTEKNAETDPVTGPLGGFALSLTPHEILFAPSAEEETQVVDGIARVVNVTLKVDGRTVEINTQPATVQAVLDQADVTLGKNDEINYKLTDQAKDGSTIVIHRITFKTETKYETIAYSTVYKGTYYLDKGQTKLVSSGSNGECKYVYVSTYRDGELIERKMESKTVTKKAVDRVYQTGVWEANTSVFPAGGVRCAAAPPAGTYSQVITARSTAYTHTGNNTASGRYPKQGQTVAVAKKHFKTGIVKKYTRVFVEGYGYAIVEDSGDKYMEAYDGYWFDVFLDTEAQCFKWGMRSNVKVYILN
ncbi:MAG: G5 domain-containing protein [Eubacteriales bacterium]|nr:G5 domain-containing protein [Eubacteriales bacterium]